MEDTQDEKKNAELVKRMMRETMALVSIGCTHIFLRCALPNALYVTL